MRGMLVRLLISLYTPETFRANLASNGTEGFVCRWPQNMLVLFWSSLGPSVCCIAG